MVRKHASSLTRVIAVLCAFALPLVACTEDPSANNTPMTSRHVSSSKCSNADLVSRGEGRTGTAQFADIDGDGSQDEVYVAHDESGVAGCKSFLVVSAGRTVYTAAVDPFGTPRALSIPRLNSITDINGDDRSEIVVDIEMGASTQFVSLFTLTDEGLVQMTAKGKAPGPFAPELGAGIFAYGGSVGHMEGIDCASDGLVQMLAAVPVGDAADIYQVEHRFFGVRGPELVLDRNMTVRERLDASTLADLPELIGSPFGSCD